MSVAPQFRKYLNSDYNNSLLGSSSVDIDQPPKDDSQTTRMELEEIQRTIDEAKLPKSILKVANLEPLRLFYSLAKQKGIDPLEDEAQQVADDYTKLSFELKFKFKRRRPYEVKKEHDVEFAHHKTDTSESPSYPSGHAMMGYGVAEFYKSKYPEMADEWENIADIIAHSRVQMGVHYPSDIKAAKSAVDQAVNSLQKTSAEKLRLYHGSPENLEALEPRQPNKGRWGEPGIYSSQDELVAALYAIARNNSKGRWGVLPDGRLIAKSERELNPEGYVYEFETDKYIEPPEDDPGIGYAVTEAPTSFSKKKVKAEDLLDRVIREDDRDKFLEYFKKTSAYKDYRPRGTLYLLDGKGGVMADKPTADYDSTTPYFFPGGGIFEEEKVDRLPTRSEIVQGVEREALEELGTKLKNVRVLQDEPANVEMPDWWRERQKKKRGVDYKGIAEFFAAAERGEQDNSIYGADNDEFKGTFYPIDEVASAIEANAKPGEDYYEDSMRQARLLRSLLEKTSSAKEQLRHILKKKAAIEDEFQPDLTPDDLKALGVYDQVYGDAPSEASMKEWPEHWINKQDPLGWLQWYERYSGGRRTEDDARQIKRWKSFKARHLAQYLKNPTPRRAAALRNWGIDVENYR